MKQITVEATFKGQNGSLGYKTGTKYDLMITHKKKGHIMMQDVKQSMPGCEYESIISFMENWDNINWKKISNPINKREIVVNYIDFFKNAPSNQVTRALIFYSEIFTPEKVMDYFKNWSIKKQPNLKKVTLTNNHSNGDKSKIVIFDDSEYSFDDNNWIHKPKNMSEFISDCLRYEHTELLFSEKAIKKIYG